MIKKCSKSLDGYRRLDVVYKLYFDMILKDFEEYYEEYMAGRDKDA